MSESALTFDELQKHVALQLGMAYFGVAGTSDAASPNDSATELMVKEYVNGGIRMFLNDAPPEGWRFQQPTASVVLWATTTAIVNGSPSFGDPETTVTVHARTFRDTMLGHKLKFTVTSTADGVPTYNSTTGVSTVTVAVAIFNGVFAVGQTVTFSATGTSYTVNTITTDKIVIVDGDASAEASADTVTITRDYVIEAVTSALVVDVTGDASSEADGATVTITADGNYTLPSTFGGEPLGPITYTAGTNAGSFLRWGSEGEVRRLREHVDTQTGYPFIAAVRKLDATNIARRWELVVYPVSSADYTVEFPYELYFTALSADTDLHPAGANYDEAVKAACEAYAELHSEDMPGPRTQYYRESVLPGAYRRNKRAAPRRLGRLSKQISGNRWSTHFGDWRDHIELPNVTTP